MQVVLPGICRQTELPLHSTQVVLLPNSWSFLEIPMRDKHRQMSEGLMGPTKRPPLVPRGVSYYCVEINETGEFGGLGCYSRLSIRHHLHAFIEWALSATFIQSDSTQEGNAADVGCTFLTPIPMTSTRISHGQ